MKRTNSRKQVAGGGSAGPAFQSDALHLSAIDDDALAVQIASIVGKDSNAADELSMLMLSLAEDLTERAPLTAALRRSVELAFGHTETWRAALDLYTLDKRGMLTGGRNAAQLIREVIRGHLPGGHRGD